MSSPTDPGADHPAMAGSGFYNLHSQQQAEAADVALDVLRRAMDSLPDTATASTIADYGASQGANSMHSVREIVSALRRRRDGDLTVVHTDQPSNDWQTLFQTVYSSPTSYLVGVTGVYPTAIGRSFYEQLLPTGSVVAGWSATAVLWLSARPAVGPGNLFSFLAGPADHRIWHEAAARDWLTFLRHRERELVDGGRLVISSLLDTGDDGYRSFLQSIDAGVRDAVRAGHVTSAEADAMTVPTYLRTRDDIEAPLCDGTVGFTILEHVETVAPNPAFHTYLAHGDRRRFAADAVAELRGWSQPSLEAALTPSRTPAERTAAIDGVYGCIGARLGSDPERGHNDWAISVLALARTG